jgi:hypothetical protein
MNSYMSGSLVTETATFLNAAGQPTDPTSVTLKYKIGAGAIQTLTYPSNLTKVSVGTYSNNFDTTGFAGPGLLLYTMEWIGTGAVQAIVPDFFTVYPPEL